MYDIPVEHQIRMMEKLKKKQFAGMTATIPEVRVGDFTENYAHEIIQRANQNGIYGQKVDYRGADGMVFHYVVLSADRASLDKPDMIETALKRDKENDRGTVCLDYKVIKLDGITKENYFSRHYETIKAIQRMGVVKTAFEEYGYPLPNHVSTQTATSIWELNAMRNKPGLTERQRETYSDTYKRAVAEYNQMYNKSRFRDLSHGVYHKQRVSERYFKTNNIAVSYCMVTDDFMRFAKNEIRKYPEFVYYKSIFPCEVEKGDGKPGQDNPVAEFFDNEKDVKKYHFAYPTSMLDVITNIKNAYTVRNLKGFSKIGELTGKSNYQLQTVYVPIQEMENIVSLCRANNVVFALNDGSYGNQQMGYEQSLEAIPVLYRFEDREMMGAIINRLSKEEMEYNPMGVRNNKSFMAMVDAQRIGGDER